MLGLLFYSLHNFSITTAQTVQQLAFSRKFDCSAKTNFLYNIIEKDVILAMQYHKQSGRIINQNYGV